MSSLLIYKTTIRWWKSCFQYWNRKRSQLTWKLAWRGVFLLQFECHVVAITCLMMNLLTNIGGRSIVSWVDDEVFFNECSLLQMLALNYWRFNEETLQIANRLFELFVKVLKCEIFLTFFLIFFLKIKISISFFKNLHFLDF